MRDAMLTQLGDRDARAIGLGFFRLFPPTSKFGGERDHFMSN